MEKNEWDNQTSAYPNQKHGVFLYIGCPIENQPTLNHGRFLANYYFLFLFFDLITRISRDRGRGFQGQKIIYSHFHLCCKPAHRLSKTGSLASQLLKVADI